ncbi:MAG TPA: hypothetical protein VKU80_05890 [Planctomycetota bacterium]|nr:hypothetical protein [Planctomycetota bacterium]
MATVLIPTLDETIGSAACELWLNRPAYTSLPLDLGVKDVPWRVIRGRFAPQAAWCQEITDKTTRIDEAHRPFRPSS